MPRKKPGGFKHILIERLMHYYHFMGQLEKGNTSAYFSSRHLAAVVDMDETQVRKDLAAIGVRGLPRVGFRVEEVQRRIREVFGFDEKREAVIVGAGHLGGALAAYSGFATYGLAFVAVFDGDSAKVGTSVGGLAVRPMNKLKPFVERRRIRLAALAVPGEAAQGVADLLALAGIQAVWNFAPVNIVVPEEVMVRHEHISVGLAELAYHLGSPKQQSSKP